MSDVEENGQNIDDSCCPVGLKQWVQQQTSQVFSSIRHLAQAQAKAVIEKILNPTSDTELRNKVR
jgi:hypothetical protein